MHCLDYLDWLFYFISQNSIEICGIQEAARNKQEQHINKHIKNFINESCSNFLAAGATLPPAGGQEYPTPSPSYS